VPGALALLLSPLRQTKIVEKGRLRKEAGLKLSLSWPFLISNGFYFNLKMKSIGFYFRPKIIFVN
jgi:hypothetical protein